MKPAATRFPAVPDDLPEALEVLGRKGVNGLVEAAVHLTAHR
jgi:hypothetical protein